MILFPVIASAILINRHKTSWRLWGIGGLVFIISQLGHIPFNSVAGKILNNTTLVQLDNHNQVLFNAIFLGLSAGIWEETSRYFAYRFWLKEPKKWNEGLALGLGHGSMESILLGLLALYVLLQMVAFSDIDLTNIIPLSKLESTYQAINQYWDANWFVSILGFIERMFTIPIQVFLSLLIVLIFKNNKIFLLFVAIILHAAVDAVAVLLITYTNVNITEGFIAIISISSIVLIIHLKDKNYEYVNIENKTDIVLNDKEKNLELDDSSLDINDTKYY